MSILGGASTTGGVIVVIDSGVDLWHHTVHLLFVTLELLEMGSRGGLVLEVGVYCVLDALG